MKSMENNPQPITVSLEKAKELREAGWIIPTYFTWNTTTNSLCGGVSDMGYLWMPTAEEILRELPDHFVTNRTKRRLTIDLSDNRIEEEQWAIFYGSHGELYELYGFNLANAAASMWIYLKNNNLLSDD